MPKRLTKDQRAAFLDILQGVNGEEITSMNELRDVLNDSENWMIDRRIWSAGESMPGCMPESPYCLFATERAARGYCRKLEREEGHRSGGYVANYMPTTLREILS